MPQVQQFYLEGMRPDMAHMANFTRTAQPPQMQRTYTIRNDVNLKKASLRLVPDEASPSKYHLEFTFDAATECTIRVFYAAVEVLAAGGAASYVPLKQSGMLQAEKRGKGLNQSFRTQASHPLDTSLYTSAELSYKAGPAGVERFPIVVCLEATGESSGASKSSVTSQTTFANLVGSEGAKTVQPLKQKIQVGATSYELQEIYGIDGATANMGDAGTSAASGGGDEGTENARECVICMTEPRDTTVLPCRHMCMCSECAKVLRMQSEKCPICRTPIEQLLQIKISKSKDEAGANAGGDTGTAAAPTEA